MYVTLATKAAVGIVYSVEFRRYATTDAPVSGSTSLLQILSACWILHTQEHTHTHSQTYRHTLPARRATLVNGGRQCRQHVCSCCLVIRQIGIQRGQEWIHRTDGVVQHSEGVRHVRPNHTAHRTTHVVNTSIALARNPHAALTTVSNS